MPSSLRQQLGELASSFAGSVLAAIRSASIDDLLSETSAGAAPARASREPRPARPARAKAARPAKRAAAKAPAAKARAAKAPAAKAPAAKPAAKAVPKSGRIPRRSAKDIVGVIDRIAGLLRESPKGLRAEDIRQKLNVRANELPRPLKEGVEGGRFTKSGNKRATTYVLKGAAASPAPVVSPAVAAKSAPRTARKPGPAKKK